MRRPSVLFLNRVYPPGQGATGRVLRDLARSFAREGWQVTIITTGEKALSERDGGIRVIRVKGTQKPRHIFAYLLVWIRMLIAALRFPATHLLVTMSDPPLIVFAGQLIKRIKKNRHIHWCHDLYPDLFPVINVRFPSFLMGFLKRLSRGAMKDCDKLIVIGRCMARHLTCHGFDPRQITVIPNWPDFELMRPANDTQGTQIQALNYNSAGAKPHNDQIKTAPKFRVLYAGNIGRAHPIETILDAAQILNEESPDIEFIFVGQGAGFDTLAKARAQRHLDNIRFLPFQPASRLRQTMESGDIHLISMKDEAAGMLVPSKLYSALAVGRPCVYVGPTQSETAKIITDFKAGAVMEQGNAVALAAQIKKYRMDGDEWFAAHNGATSASRIFVPKEAIHAWIERAWSVVEPDMRKS